MTDILDGKIEINTTRYYIKVSGDEEQLQQYIKSAVDIIPQDNYQAIPYTDYAINILGQKV